jgi:sn-glycerol 3-phosphate transport system ATP-binding protein
MATLSISHAEKYYGTTQVLFDINVEVKDGEFIVIVGPSGCGKSTLLRMVAGLEQVSAGEIHIGGRLVNNLEPKDRDIAMVFQNYALYPHMSVFKNMAYGLKLKGVATAEIERRVSEVAKLLHLEEFLQRKPRQLSGGQRQRVAMGRAIVREPEVFLFDEPLSNLDAKLRVRMRLEIKKLQKRLGVTSLYVTHDQIEAMTMADRLVVMNGGIAEQVGRPMDLYYRPDTMFVAGFIGSPAMNFLTLKPSSEDCRLGGTLLDLPQQARGMGQVIAGIRPEHFQFDSHSSNGTEFVVDLVEPLGADYLVHGRLAGHSEEMVVRVPERIPIDSSSIHVVINPEKVLFFDPASEKRIA